MPIDYILSNDTSICKELGSRIKALRLKHNLRQKDVADETGLSRDSIKRLERGAGSLLTLIAVLRCLHALDQLDLFIQPTQLDPISIADMQGKVRVRASGGKP